MAKVQTSLRLEEEPLLEAKAILSQLGMNYSEAVNVFTRMIVEHRGLPFPVQLKQTANPTDLRTILAQFPDDFMADGREQPTQQQEREAAFE